MKLIIEDFPISTALLEKINDLQKKHNQKFSIISVGEGGFRGKDICFNGAVIEFGLNATEEIFELLQLLKSPQ